MTRILIVTLVLIAISTVYFTFLLALLVKCEREQLGFLNRRLTISWRYSPLPAPLLRRSSSLSIANKSGGELRRLEGILSKE